jgi:superfamily II DNA or RNA helicase
VSNLLPELWPHQKASIAAVELAMAAGRETGLIVLPVGTGKTGMVLSLGRRLGVPMLFLVNRDVLLGQTIRAAARFWPEAHVAGIEAGVKDWDVVDLHAGRKPDLAVGMVLSVLNRLDTIDPERFGIVVFDEAHYAPAPTNQTVLKHFRPGFRLGVTATPQRLDGKGLAGTFGKEPLYSYSLHQAIKDGRLCPVRSERILTDVSLDGIKSDGEDLDEKQLARAVNTGSRNDQVVSAYLQHARGRRAVCFCVDVEHAENMAAAFKGAALRSVAVVRTKGKGNEWQRRTLAEFERGEFDVLTTCEVLTTGFDDPGVSCILWCRPTESRTLYIQGTGRGLRLDPANPSKDCLVLDVVDNCKKHKLVSVLDLIGKQKPLQNNGSSSPRPAASPRFIQPNLPLATIVGWTLETVCPWPELPSLDGYIPTLDWHNDPASDGQMNYLSRFGLAPQEALSKGEAAYLLDRAQEFDACYPMPATPKQRRFLEERGMWTDGTSKRQASTLIDMAKAKETLTEQHA